MVPHPSQFCVDREPWTSASVPESVSPGFSFFLLKVNLVKKEFTFTTVLEKNGPLRWGKHGNRIRKVADEG